MQIVVMFDSRDYKMLVDTKSNKRLLMFNYLEEMNALFLDWGVVVNKMRQSKVGEHDVHFFEVVSVENRNLLNRFYWEDPFLFRARLKSKESEQEKHVLFDRCVLELYEILNRLKARPSFSVRKNREFVVS
jgi:hypothetical protein